MLTKEAVVHAVAEGQSAARVKDLPLAAVLIVGPLTTLTALVEGMQADIAVLPAVTNDGRTNEVDQVAGIVNKDRIVDAAAAALALFSDRAPAPRAT